MLKFKLTNDDFYRAVALLKRFSERPKNTAYDVIVNGKTIADAAKIHDVTYQAANKAVNRVVKSWETLNGGQLSGEKKAAEERINKILSGENFPEDWETVVVCLPKSKAGLVRDMEKKDLSILQK